MKILKDGNELCGSTCLALISKAWHKKNPKAAKHYFGFPSWKETVCMLHALFGFLPPNNLPLQNDVISPFE